MIEISISFLLLIVITAFFCEYMDSSLGMGYGTTLTPVLLLFGFTPLQVIPAVLLSELITGILAALYHHKEGNANFHLKSKKIPVIIKKIKQLGLKKSFQEGTSLHLRIALLLSLASIIGSIGAVFIAINISTFYLKLYIGILVLSMGVIIYLTRNRSFSFSWKKVTLLGTIASFNKGMSGGGYGPVVTSGQILSGLKGKNAVSITSLAEGLTCAIALILYTFYNNQGFDFTLAPFLISGAMISIPFSVKTVKKIKTQNFKKIIAIATIILGIFSLIKTFNLI